MKHSLKTSLQVFYNCYIGSLCNYPTFNNNNNSNSNFYHFNFRLGYHNLALHN